MTLLLDAPSAVLPKVPPRVLHLPTGVVGSSGPEVIELAADVGLILDDWQAWSVHQILGERADGMWAATDTCEVVARQNGKDAIIEAIELGGLLFLGEQLIIHTAHLFPTAKEHFRRMTGWFENVDWLRRKVKRITEGNTVQIELLTGQRLLFMARTGKSGRGLTGDRIVLNEAQTLSSAFVAALENAQAARTVRGNPQMNYFGTAGDSSSAHLHALRRRGVAGEDPRYLYLEWSAPEGARAARGNVDYVLQANPGIPHRISLEWSLAQADKETPDDPTAYERERLSLFDPEPSSDEASAKLPAGAWESSRSDRRPTMVVGEVAFGFDVHDGWASIVAASGTLGHGWVEVTGDPATGVPDHRSGVHWLPARLVELVERWRPRVIGLDGGNGPALGVLAEVREAFTVAGLDPEVLQPLTTGAYKTACEGFFTGVKDGKINRPRIDPDQLHTAGAHAAERRVGDQWLWHRSCRVPISPLVAATVARSLLAADADPALMFAY